MEVVGGGGIQLIATPPPKITYHIGIRILKLNLLIRTLNFHLLFFFFDKRLRSNLDRRIAI